MSRRAAPQANRIAARQGEGTPVNAAIKSAPPMRASMPVPIGQAARLSQVSAKMIRHYESLGLLPQVARSDNGYRQYSDADVRTLQFIKRGRNLGFSMAEIAELVDLWRNRKRASASVKRIAQKHVDELSARIAAMQAMQRSLHDLLQHCHGDARPDCPILDDLAGGKARLHCAHD